MNFDEYQKQADSTAIYPGKGKMLGFMYTVLGLTGETGEINQKLKKILRDKGGEITEEFKLDIAKELGDVLWYVAQIATEVGFALDDIARINLDKLASRKERGTLQGSGDNR